MNGESMKLSFERRKFPDFDTEKEHTLSYKYHAIIILSIILTSIVIIMRKRKKSANEK